MRVLMITMQYPTGPGQSYLTTELADALVAAGHEIEVLHLDWSASRTDAVQEFRTTSGVRVVRCAPRHISGFGSLVQAGTKFLLSGRHAANVARQHFDLSAFDAAITWMPATAIASLVNLLEPSGIFHRLLFIWDFFPNHHHEIGRIPSGPALWIARAWERRLIANFTSIICTMRANADYLRRNFPIRPDQRVLTMPIWGNASMLGPVDRTAIRRRHGLPLKEPVAVFGGQLVEGRGFDQMLDAADIALAQGSPLTFLFVGDGPLAARIRHRSETQPNILYHPALSRDDYLQLLGACDVGMVATVPGVSSFSFPSKTIDYLRASLPIVASVEQGSAFTDILARYRVGGAVPFGDPVLFYSEAERLALSGRISEAAERCLREVFDVRHAVATVAEAACATAAPIRIPKPKQSAPSQPRRQSVERELRRSR
jgi:glycosyltransferase involved in cell wall biosynthesis